MGDIVSLKQARRRRDREESDLSAVENRRKHGRSKAEMLAEAKLEAQRKSRLDARKIDKDPKT